MQTQRDVGVFCGIGACLVEIDFVEANLLRALAGNVLVLRCRYAEILCGDAVHVVARCCRVQHIRFEHRVVGDAAQTNAVVLQYVSVVLQMMADLLVLRVLEPVLQFAEYQIAVELLGCADIAVSDRYVGSLQRLCCQ